MDGKWSGDIFLLGSSSLANHALLDQKLWKICGVFFFFFISALVKISLHLLYFWKNSPIF
jgi:hypothetical protein